MSHIIDDIEHEIETHLSILFRVSMWWRIFYGFLRIILGTALLRMTGQTISDFVYSLLSHEITGKMTDVVLEKIYIFSEIHEITITYFIAFYFIFWGTVDIVLSLCLLNHIRKAFPIAMGLIVLFILYSIFRFTFTHSLVLAGVIILDFIILYLINDEYKLLQKTSANTSTLSDPLPHQS